VKSPGVIIEGTSVLRFIKPDFAVMVARRDQTKIKSSARRVLADGLVDALYFSGEDAGGSADHSLPPELVENLAVHTPAGLRQMIDRIQRSLRVAVPPEAGKCNSEV
jgi:hypothetical protein